MRHEAEPSGENAGSLHAGEASGGTMRVLPSTCPIAGKNAAEERRFPEP
jgi:hypothetical protein